MSKKLTDEETHNIIRSLGLWTVSDCLDRLEEHYNACNWSKVKDIVFVIVEIYRINILEHMPVETRSPIYDYAPSEVQGLHKYVGNSQSKNKMLFTFREEDGTIKRKKDFIILTREDLKDDVKDIPLEAVRRLNVKHSSLTKEELESAKLIVIKDRRTSEIAVFKERHPHE